MYSRRFFGGRMFGPRFWGGGEWVAPPIYTAAMFPVSHGGGVALLWVRVPS